MNRQRKKLMHSEPTVLDTALDAGLINESAKIDWHSVSEAEASSFGLALGLYRDVAHTCEKRRVAWGTAVGGVISMSVIAISCLLIGTGPWFAISVVVCSQLVRALWLYLKAYQSSRDVRMLGDQALDVVKELATIHPAGDPLGD
jgi:hypothetical protein